MVKIISFIVCLFPFAAFAGNPLVAVCDGEFIKETRIDSVSYSSNWLRKGPSVNVKVNGIWYGKLMSDNADKFTSALNDAYLNRVVVNVCVNNGYLRGFEFQPLDSGRSLSEKEELVIK
ncbi:hypothetical protein [Photorhabdus antumapuensis]|uniref:hypothetical protein n=1 Tax=Photorhabdus antumapuensis TaxID=2862867 RepID=UPI001CEC0DEB|nr:hypothetical protein [Photorhabdus antumapuensis]MCA6221488.1 hypothetical protein [Photorhabdus antumapuensis]